ncbi:unnamed protein product, partial [Symbiodinium sp. KB8]
MLHLPGARERPGDLREHFALLPRSKGPPRFLHQVVLGEAWPCWTKQAPRSVR